MKRFYFLFLILIILLSSCNNKEVVICKTDILDTYRNMYELIIEQKEKSDDSSLNLFYEQLGEKERIGQLFLISLDGNSVNHLDRIVTSNEYVPGGFLLFAFNIPQNADETVDFLSGIENKYLENGKVPPYISIDHEGGIVNRLRNICSKLPSQLNVAQKFSISEAERLYELQGIQLKNLGIQVNLAPVVEVLTDENILFLDDRSYGDFTSVTAYSKAQITGMKNAGVLPVLKHFPGNTNNDPHTGLPILECDLQTLKDTFVAPFEVLTENNMAGVLVAHTVIPAIENTPSCLSEKVIHMLDSENHNYGGLVFSDDLLMKALIKNGYPVEQSLISAINAGVNVLMISSGSFDKYADIILEEYRKNEDFKNKVDDSVRKILEWKISCNLLSRRVLQKGFFEYEATVGLPEKISETEIAGRKQDFQKAYEEASKLYNNVWWSK